MNGMIVVENRQNPFAKIKYCPGELSELSSIFPKFDKAFFV
jgi:hypothetical protein